MTNNKYYNYLAMTKLSKKDVVLSIAVGDLVTTEYFECDAHVKRKVIKVENSANTGSTVRIWADDGGRCRCCNRPLSKPIDGVDGAWFIPA